MTSPEAIKANEALLERMLTDSVTDPRTRMLSGTRTPEPTEHSDLRMRMELRDMMRFYDPPMVPGKDISRLVIKREGPTQVQTEAMEVNKNEYR